MMEKYSYINYKAYNHVAFAKMKFHIILADINFVFYIYMATIF